MPKWLMLIELMEAMNTELIISNQNMTISQRHTVVEVTEATQTSDKLQLGNMILDQDLLKIETTKGIEIDQDLQITEEMILQDQMNQIEDIKEETTEVSAEVLDIELITEVQEETMIDQTAGKEKDHKLKDQGMIMIMVAV